MQVSLIENVKNVTKEKRDFWWLTTTPSRRTLLVNICLFLVTLLTSAFLPTYHSRLRFAAISAVKSRDFP